MKQALREIGVLKLFIIGIALWVARLAVSFPFLDENASVPSISSDGRIPANVEYFFSALIGITVFGALVGASHLILRAKPGIQWKQGLVVSFGFLLCVSTLDILFTVILGEKTLTAWFLNAALDYTPFFWIPLFIGYVLWKSPKIEH